MHDSKSFFSEAKALIPGGVNSPVRAFAAVGGDPIFIDHAEGAYLFSVEGKKYIDYIGSWGPAILGHAEPSVIAAVQETAAKGLSFGAPSPLESKLAAKICGAMPSMEQIRMVSSGTEATMSAIRLARGFTGRDKIVKFEGCYHGHGDALLVKAGSGALTLGVPTSPGIPKSFAGDTLVQPFNDLHALEQCFKEWGQEIACVIIEPIAGNMNMVVPSQEYMLGLNRLCQDHGSLVIFDEVMTGFRVGPGGAQGLWGMQPDLTTLGKVIGGGMPVGAFGGRRDVMQHLAPAGPVYQAGTLSGNPVAMAAGLATLEKVLAPGFFDDLERKTSRLIAGLSEVAAAAKVPLSTSFAGGMFGFAFTDRQPLTNFADVQTQDPNKFMAFFGEMLEGGVYLAPSCYEAGFISQAHSDEDIDTTIAVAQRALEKLG